MAAKTKASKLLTSDFRSIGSQSPRRAFAPGGNIDGAMKNPFIVMQRIDELRPSPFNPRTHTDKQIAQIAACIHRFGFTNPVLVGTDGDIIAGHGRVLAAQLLGWTHVPVLKIGHLSASEKRAYALADNKLAELAGWDDNLLAVEFAYLSNLNLDFDLSVTGFSTAEIDLALDPPSARSDERANELPSETSVALPVSKTGDTWELGPHRLLCGDTRRLSTFHQLMQSGVARMVFTDAPYNVRIPGNVTRSKRARHTDFDMASGEMNSAQYTEFLRTVATNHAVVSMDGAISFYCMDWKHAPEMLTAGNSVYSEHKNIVVWDKGRGGMGSFYRSQHELIFVFKKGRSTHVNNFELGQFGRYRTNVWSYPSPTSAAAGGNCERHLHPTIKPVALVADAIKDCSHRGEIVLDGFAGSGTTIIAAEKTGRIARAIELAPKFVDLSVRRWEAFTGKSATLLETGETMSEVAARRAIAATARVRHRRAA